jgi:uncharacterized beta-barrel protein YwiB (DUF1934 family)
MKNVKVTIIGEQRNIRDEKNVEPVELVTRGVYHKKGNNHFLKYDEYFEDFDEPAKNLLRFNENELHITKKGAVNSVMTFVEGDPVEAYYTTQAGTLYMSILTERYIMKETEDAVALSAGYVMDYGKGFVTFNILNIVIEG